MWSLLIIGIGCTLGRAPRTKETLPDFREWCLVTRHPRVFHGLTGCQRTPGIGVLQIKPKEQFFLGWGGSHFSAGLRERERERERKRASKLSFDDLQSFVSQNSSRQELKFIASMRATRTYKK